MYAHALEFCKGRHRRATPGGGWTLHVCWVRRSMWVQREKLCKRVGGKRGGWGGWGQGVGVVLGFGFLQFSCAHYVLFICFAYTCSTFMCVGSTCMHKHTPLYTCVDTITPRCCPAEKHRPHTPPQPHHPLLPTGGGAGCSCQCIRVFVWQLLWNTSWGGCDTMGSYCGMHEMTMDATVCGVHEMLLFCSVH